MIPYLVPAQPTPLLRRCVGSLMFARFLPSHPNSTALRLPFQSTSILCFEFALSHFMSKRTFVYRRIVTELPFVILSFVETCGNTLLSGGWSVQACRWFNYILKSSIHFRWTILIPRKAIYIKKQSRFSSC